MRSGDEGLTMMAQAVPPDGRRQSSTLIPMPPRSNPWTHLQSVQFDHEREPKMRQVRLTTQSPRAGELARIGVSGVEVEAVIMSVVAGKVKRAAAKMDSSEREQKRKRQ